MATTPIEFTLPSGSGSVDVYIFADGSDTVADLVTGVTEETNRKGLWIASYTGPEVGMHYVVLAGDGGGIIGSVTWTHGSGWVNLEDTTAIHKVESSKALATGTDLTTSIDEFFKRDMSAITGESPRSLLNAIRFLRNKWSITGTTLTVTKEDDTTAAWTSTIGTDPAADPITSNDPA